MLHHLLQNAEGDGRDVGTHEGSLRNMVRGANRGRDDLDLLAIDRVGSKIVVVDRRHDIGDLLKAVFRDVVESADEGADVTSTGASSEKSLRNTEAKRHVNGNALGSKSMSCSKTLDHSRDLNDHVRRDRRKLTTIGDNLVTLHSYRFS